MDYVQLGHRSYGGEVKLERTSAAPKKVILYWKVPYTEILEVGSSGVPMQYPNFGNFFIILFPAFISSAQIFRPKKVRLRISPNYATLLPLNFLNVSLLTLISRTIFKYLR